MLPVIIGLAARIGGQSVIRNVGAQLLKKGSAEGASKIGKDILQEAVTDILKDGGMSLLKKGGKDLLKEVINDFLKEGGTNALEMALHALMPLLGAEGVTELFEKLKAGGLDSLSDKELGQFGDVVGALHYNKV